MGIYIPVFYVGVINYPFPSLCQQKRSLWPYLLTWFNFNPSMDK